MNSYLYLKIDGLNINRFLLKCNKKNINIIKIKYISYKSIIIFIREKDYEKINKIKGIYKIKVINKKGNILLKEKIIKYKIFLISCVIGLILLIILSNIVFDIDIITNNNLLSKRIRNELKEYGIDKYCFKKSYEDIEKIKRSIKNKFKDNIEWLEIKNNGTKVIVNIVERKVNKKSIDNEIYSIVSTKNSIVKNIIVEQGESKVQKEQYVKKGDILITSDLVLNEEIKDRVSARGKVYGETWYKVRIEYPLNYSEIKYTKNTRKIPFIKLGNNYYELFKYKSFDRKTIFSNKDNLNIFEIGFEEIKEKKIINKRYSLKEAKIVAIKEATNKIKQRLKKGEYIISQNTLNFYDNGSKIILEEFFSVYEEIGEKRVIEMGEEYGTTNNRESFQ